jgi:hypothetical protein
MSSSKYIQGADLNVKNYLKAKGNISLPKRAATPFAQSCRPEMDASTELDPERASYFQSQIGVLRWCVELGRVDIITEVSMLASHLALPREGHLEAALHILAYLEKKHNVDPKYPKIDKAKLKEVDWKVFYGDAKEAIPPNALPPLGKDVNLRFFVDSDHAGDHQTRQ